MLTSPSFQEFMFLALFKSARVVLGSSKVPLQVRGVHPEPHFEARFGDESIDNLKLEDQNLIEKRMKK